MIEHGYTCDFEEKAVSDAGDHFVVTGYGAVFNHTDLGNDVILPGAFTKSLREHGLPLYLFNHKMDDAPIGTIVDAKEDKKGLWYRAHLPKDDSFVSGRIIPQLKMRGIKSNSIGYRPTVKNTRRDGVRELKEIRLIEISVVNLPMQPLANVESVKRDCSDFDPALLDAFEHLVKSADNLSSARRWPRTPPPALVELCAALRRG